MIDAQYQRYATEEKPPAPPPSDPAVLARMNAAQIRAAFLVERLFVPDQVTCRCLHLDRAVIGAAVPVAQILRLPNCKELAADYFAQRRELGVINIGGAGMIRADGSQFRLANREALYIGRGTREVDFSSADARNPAQFYFVSYPAHAVLPCSKVGRTQAESTELGSTVGANRRTINKLIYPGGVASCQLTMGCTDLADGSVWNTMPAHTHSRRSEIYLYFDLPEPNIVVHCTGAPHETRHVVVRDRQAVLSPGWFLHFGVGTAGYSFVWSMGGENQEFGDMDMVSMEALT